MKRSTIIIIVCISLLTQSGCSSRAGVLSNSMELENLRLVQTMGFDTDEAGIRLSASTGTIDADGGKVLVSRPGETVAKAMESVQRYVPDGRLYFSHSLFVVISEELAREGVDVILDYMQRDAHMRMDTGFLVLKNGTVEDLMNAYGEDEDITEALESIKRDLSQQGENHIFDFRETAIALSERGCALICALRSSSAGASVLTGDVESVALTDGYGILRDGKLVGYVDPGWDSLVVGLIRGYLRSAVMTVPDGVGRASLESSSSNYKVTPRWAPDGGLESIDLHVELGAAVISLEDTDADTSDAAFLEKLARELEAHITEHLGSVIRLQQELDADFLDFTTPLRISGGQRFYDLPRDWIATTPVTFSVRCRIDHSYDVSGTTNTGGGGGK